MLETNQSLEVDGSVGVVSELIRWDLIHFVGDLKDAQLNLQYSQIRELLLYDFEVGHNTNSTTKNYDTKCNDKDDNICVGLILWHINHSR